MKQQNFLIALLCALLLAIGIWSLWMLMKQRDEMSRSEDAQLTEPEARAIAELNTDCAEVGPMASHGSFDSDTQSWKFDMKLQDGFERDGCEAICQVNDRTKESELVWDCDPDVSPSPSDTPTASELVQVISPEPNMTVRSPLTVSGQARGNWFFEGSFPLKLLDGSGNTIATGIAHAQRDSMTEDFVPFMGIIDFTVPPTTNGILILEKDNPSGLPENADEVRVAINFAQESPSPSPSFSPSASPDIAADEIQLFYYNPENDKDSSGNILCSDQGLTPVTRSLDDSASPIEDTIKMLIAGELTPEEEAQGITTEFPLNGFLFTGSELVNGELTLSFSDPQFQTTGGSCRASILWAQINATAKQFPGVQTVRFEPEELFQP